MSDPSQLAAKLSMSVFALCGAVYLIMLGLKDSSTTAPAMPASLDPSIFITADIIPPVATEKFISSDPKANSEGTINLIDEIKGLWPDDHRRTFLISIAPHALTSAVDHCVPPSITLAQAILESGWGRSGLAKAHHNLFGMKSGASSNGVRLKTREVTNGIATHQQARFRTYEGWHQSITDHGSLLSNDPRYAKARTNWEHWPLFLKTLAPVYATDPQYIEHISSLVEDYHLDKWDELVTRAAQRRSDCAEWKKPLN